MDIAIGMVSVLGMGILCDLVKTVCNSLGVTTKSSDEFKEFFLKAGVFNKEKEMPELDSVKKKEFYITYKFKMPLGLSERHFNELDKEISLFLGCKSVHIERQSTEVLIHSMIKRPDIKYNPTQFKKDKFKVPVGINLKTGEVLYWNFSSDNACNLLIAGTPGNGKTNIVKLILSHIINVHDDTEVEISINDTKDGIDFIDFKDSKKVKKISVGTRNIQSFLEEEMIELQARAKIFSKLGYSNIRDLISDGYSMSYRFVIIEEMKLLSSNPLFVDMISNLTSIGRSFGFVIILVTQTPTYDVIRTEIKNNMNCRLGLKVMSSICSDIVMEEANLHKLEGKGHFKITDDENSNLEGQAFSITSDIVKSIVSKNNKN